MARVYIPTLGRAERQLTYKALPVRWQRETVLVVSAFDEQLAAYATLQYPHLVCPTKGIGRVRQFILEHHYKTATDARLLMLDDDLRFAVRRKDDPTKFREAEVSDVDNCLQNVFAALENCVHIGIMTREGANRQSGLATNTRLLRALGYRAGELMHAKVRFDRLPVMEDFDVTLQLLRLGYPNVCLGQYVQDQAGSNLAGGCSTYRTMQVQRQGALGLQKLHPSFVTVVQKQTKTAWGGKPRTDVRIQWKAAYESSQL